MTTERVVFAVLHVDGDAARGLPSAIADRQDVGAAMLRRPTIANDISTIASLVTGARPSRHGAFTRLIPAEGRTEGQPESRGPAMVEADLRPRSSRDLGAPVVWNRLASRGIVSAAIGWPFVEMQDDDHVLELGMNSLMSIASENEVTAAEAMLGAIRGGIESRPELACLCLYGWFREGAAEDSSDEDSDADADADADADGGDEDERPAGVTGEQKAAVIVSWLDAVRTVSEATQMVVVMVAPRIGRFLVFGPHAASVADGWGQMAAAVPTVLAMLGEPPATDLPGQPLFEDDADHGPSAGGWAIEGGTLTPPDFAPAIARVTAGEGGDLLRSVVVRHLTQALWIGISDGDAAAAVDAGRRLIEIDPSPPNHLRLILAHLAAGQVAEAVKQVDHLKASHPDSVVTDIATTLQPLRATDDEVGAVLDRHPFASLPGPLVRGVWARAAARIGRRDEALDGLWRLIIGGYALNHDRLAFATLAVERNEDQDAARAALATRGMTGLGVGAAGRPRTGVALLRARALDLSGRRPAAVALLERFVERHPLEEQAVVMLKKLRENGE